MASLSANAVADAASDAIAEQWKGHLAPDPLDLADPPFRADPPREVWPRAPRFDEE